MDKIVLALDRASVRTKDADGRLHVALVPLTKANVSGYLGREIPGYQELGLNPDQIYNLYRDADALQKAVTTANNIPLLSQHEPVTAEKPEKQLIVGSTGTDAQWRDPYITNSLVVWDAKMIDLIENNQQKQISAGYRYTAVMKSGEMNGDKFDGKMVDIRFNHIAVVVEGRVGPDVIIGDSKENLNMKDRNTAGKAKLAASALAMAKDGKFDELKEFLDAFSQPDDAAAAGVPGADPVEETDAEPPALGGAPEPGEQGVGEAPGEEGGDPVDEIKAFLSGILTPEQMQQLDAKIAKLGQGGAEKPEGEEAAEPPAEGAEKPEAKPKPKAPGEDEGGANDPTEPVVNKEISPFGKGGVKGEDEQEMDNMVTKPAMDAAIAAAQAAERRNSREIRDAEKAVRPVVGEMAIASDSAAKVYQTALKMRGVKDAEKVNDLTALKAMFGLLPVPGKREPSPRIAADAARAKGYSERFPEAARVSRI